MKAELACNIQSELGEGPVWDVKTNTIFWLDIKKGIIHRLHTETNNYDFFKTDEMIGCIAPRKQGGFIAGLQNGIGFIDDKKNMVQHIINPEAGIGNRFNDGKCDAGGRFWVGSMSLKEEENKGNLYVFDKDFTIKKKIDNLTISNGLAWNADNTIFYLINTPTDYVFAFDYDINTAQLTNQRVGLDLSHEDGHADGMTIDEDGMLWIAFYGGWHVARYDPSNGSLLQRIELPVENVTSCTFGGKQLNDLYITTASQGMSAEVLQQQPDAGKLFVVKGLNVKGTIAQPFNS